MSLTRTNSGFCDSRVLRPRAQPTRADGSANQHGCRLLECPRQFCRLLDSVLKMYYEPGSESTGEAALAEIGRITAAFEAITAYLVMAVADLIGTDRNIGIAVASRMSFRNLLELLQDLYPQPYDADEDRDSLKALLRRLRETEEARNVVLHSLWNLAGQARIKLPKGHSEWSHTQYSVEELRNIALQMVQLSREVHGFFWPDDATGFAALP